MFVDKNFVLLNFNHFNFFLLGVKNLVQRRKRNNFRRPIYLFRVVNIDIRITWRRIWLVVRKKIKKKEVKMFFRGISKDSITQFLIIIRKNKVIEVLSKLIAITEPFYLLKVRNGNSRIMYKIRLKLVITFLTEHLWASASLLSCYQSQAMHLRPY